MAAEIGDPPNDGDLSVDDWGRHLRADYRHDKLGPATFYNVGGAPKAGRGREFGEYEFLDYALALPYITTNATFKARYAGQIDFMLPDKTATFDGTTPKFFDAGNGMIGLVMDAGKNITKYVGAQNAISFGMCIDPAGSSIHPKDKPVYYEPPRGNRKVYIELKQFGFEPSVIRGIWIVDVLGGSMVKSIWVMGDGELIDPVGRRKLGDLKAGQVAHDPAVLTDVIIRDLRAKPINVVDIELAGYYTSIDKAKGATGKETDRYKMGKTLGDTMIIASAMATFKRFRAGTNIVEEVYDNPYYGLGPDARGEWLNHFNRNNDYPYEIRPPQTLLVKTGDLLNSVRAIFKGVPVIMERQAAGGKPKFFRYTPGLPSVDQLLDAIGPGYDRMIAECTRRYTELATSIGTAVIGNVYNPEYLSFATGSRPERIRLTPERSEAAAGFVRRSKAEVERLRGICVQYLTNMKAAAMRAIRNIVAAAARNPDGLTMNDIEAIRVAYEEHTNNMLAMSPQTTSILLPNRTVMPVIIITHPGPTPIRLDDDGNTIEDMQLHLFAAISGIVENKPWEPYVNSRFFDLIPAAPGPGAAAPAAVSDAVFNRSRSYVFDTLCKWVDYIAGFLMPSPKRGGGVGDKVKTERAAAAGPLPRKKAVKAGDPVVKEPAAAAGPLPKKKAASGTAAAGSGEPEEDPAAAAKAAWAAAAPSAAGAGAGAGEFAVEEAGEPEALGAFAVRKDLANISKDDSLYLINRFLKYAEETGFGGTAQELLSQLFNVLRMMNTNRIADTYVLESIEQEFFNMKRWGYIDFPTAVSADGSLEIRRGAPDAPSTPTSLLFNAFVMRLNAQNMDMRYIDEAGEYGYIQPNNPFIEMESRFFDHINRMRGGRTGGGRHRTFRQKRRSVKNKDATGAA